MIADASRTNSPGKGQASSSIASPGAGAGVIGLISRSAFLALSRTRASGASGATAPLWAKLRESVRSKASETPAMLLFCI